MRQLIVLLMFIPLIACTPVAQPSVNPTTPTTLSPVPSPLATTMLPVPSSTVPAPAATATPQADSRPTPFPPMVDPKTLVTNLVKQDVAKQTGVSVDAVVITRIEEHEWPDTSLGCPKPGFAYAQVIIFGWLVEAQAAGKTFEYHTGNDSRLLVLCKPG